MAEITWIAEAQRWLEDIFEYVAADNPQAAARTVQGIYERAQDLHSFPEMGHAIRRLLAMCASCFTGITGLPTSSKTMGTLTSLVSFTARLIPRDISFE